MLDATQLEVVTKVSRLNQSLLVIGGPGSGKTTALVASVARLVSQGVPLDQIVVLAHARPAAQRLRRQVMSAVGATSAAPRITTVHGWCRALMESFGGAVRLLSAPEQEFRVRELLPGTDWPDELKQAALSPAFAGQVRGLLTRARQLGMDPSGLAAAGLSAGRPDWVAAASFFETYLDVIDQEQVLDYAELVHRARLLMVEDDVKASVAAHNKVVLVDDFTECDESIVALLSDIWRAAVPVIAFGDPSTRILGFRGAWAGAPAAFPEEFASGTGPAPVVSLTACYRQATDRQAWLAQSIGDEPAMLADQLWLAHQKGANWHDMAVIGRTGGPELARLARGLASAGIPVRIEGELLALRDAPAVQLLLAGLDLVTAQAAGTATAEQWLAVLTSPLVGLDDLDLPGPVPVGVCSDPLALFGQTPPPAELLRAVQRVNDLAGKLPGTHVSELAWGVWTLGDWPQQLQRASLERAEPALRADRDLDAVIALFDLAGAHPQLLGAAGVVALSELVDQQVVQRDRAREADDPVGVVTVLSAYQSKGRGWPVVAVTGAVEGAWPMPGAIASLLEPDSLSLNGALPSSTRGETVASARRLFALSISRAGSRLIITGAPPSSDQPAQPSRFIHEIGLTPNVWQAGAVATSPRELVGQLRAVAVATDEAPALADGAVALLQQLYQGHQADGRPLAPMADPRRWWWVGGTTKGRPQSEAVRISAGGVTQLLACPRRWFLQSQAGASPLKGDAAWLGQLAHWMFETCAKNTPPEIEAALTEQWAKTPLAKTWRQASQMQGLLEVLQRFETWRDGRSGRCLAGTETKFTQIWPTAQGPVEIRGRVDRLETDEAGRLVVIDFKTSTSRRPADYADQVGIYALAAERGAFSAVSEVAPPELVWPGVEPRKCDIGCPVDPGEPDHAMVVGHVEQAAAIIRSGRFDATPNGDSCHGCVFRDGCPAAALVGAS